MASPYYLNHPATLRQRPPNHNRVRIASLEPATSRPDLKPGNAAGASSGSKVSASRASIHALAQPRASIPAPNVNVTASPTRITPAQKAYVPPQPSTAFRTETTQNQPLFNLGGRGGGGKSKSSSCHPSGPCDQPDCSSPCCQKKKKHEDSDSDCSNKSDSCNSSCKENGGCKSKHCKKKKKKCHKQKLSGWAIAAIVIFIVLVLFLLACGCWATVVAFRARPSAAASTTTTSSSRSTLTSTTSGLSREGGQLSFAAGTDRSSAIATPPSPSFQSPLPGHRFDASLAVPSYIPSAYAR